MTHFTVKNLNQTCIYWPAPVNDGYGGHTWEEPVELSCRWEDLSQVLTSNTGVETVAQSNVQVDQDLDHEGMLLLGTLDDLDSDAYYDPIIAGAHAIIRIDKVPTLDGLHFYRKVFLSYRGTHL